MPTSLRPAVAGLRRDTYVDINDKTDGGRDLVSVGVRRSGPSIIGCPIRHTLGPETSETRCRFSIRVIRVIRGRLFPEIGVH